MTTTLQYTLKDAGATASGQILSPLRDIGAGVPVAVAAANFTGAIYGCDSVSGQSAYCGYRRAISSVTFADRAYIQFQLAHGSLEREPLDTWANGGIRLVFEDALGNWAAFKVFGSDWNIFESGNNGYFGPNSGFETSTSTYWHIERARTPDYTSATPIDWTQIVAYEIHFKTRGGFGAGRKQIALANLRTLDPSISTGSVSTLMSQLGSAWADGGGNQRFPFKSILDFMQGFSSLVWLPQMGFQVGNGATATTGTISNFGLGFWNPPEDTYNNAYVGTGSFVLLATPRLVDINQSASDSVTFSDATIASSRYWGWKLRGNTGATCAVNRLTFVRAGQFECAHGTYTDCIWDGHTAAIQLTAQSSIVRGTVRNGVGHGIQITGAAGTYNSSIAFSGNTTYDIELGSGGAGTYNLPNITVTGTLKLRNNSATNAIVVAVPSGTATSTSTAGGTITVSTPPLYQSVTINGLVAGSRVQIYDTTSSTELYNQVVGGVTVTWTDTVPASASRAIRVRIAKVATVTAYNFLEANIGTCGTGTTDSALTYLANQTLDTVYNSNAIDGSGVTGITITDSIDRVIISLAGGSVTWPSIYAYQCYWNFTAAGIIDDGAIITASDTANYRVVGFKIRNSSAVPLTITGGYGVDSVTGLTATIIDSAGSTGNIYTSPEHVVAYQSSGGLSTSDRALLQSASDNSSNIASGASVVYANLVSVKGHTLTGSGAGPYV